MNALFRKCLRLLPGLSLCILLSSCSRPPESTRQLLDRAIQACDALHSYSTAYQFSLALTTGDGNSIQSVTQIYTDLDLEENTCVCSTIETISDAAGSQVQTNLSYYLPEASGAYLHYFTYDQTNWFVQTTPQADSCQSFSYLSLLTDDVVFCEADYEGTPVYKLETSGSLFQLSQLLSVLPDQSEAADMETLDAQFVCMLDQRSYLPQYCALTCTDPTGAFADTLGYSGGSLDSFTIEIFYDGFNKVIPMELPEAARTGAQDLGMQVDAALPTDEDGRALLHASTEENSPVVAIETPQYFTLDEGFSNLCNACYSVITDAGTVSLHFTLEQGSAPDWEAKIAAELDSTMDAYSKEDAYSNVTRLKEPQYLELNGRRVGCDWLTYLYTYSDDSSLSGQTEIYAAEYNFWTEPQDGLLLRCYACALVQDLDVGCPTPSVLAELVFADITIVP